jgi:TRAP-type transport system periplasmic protein
MNSIDMTRRQILTRAICVGSALPLSGCGLPVVSTTTKWTGRQFHNQPVQSHQHVFLADMWSQVAKETDGRLLITVFPQNNKIAGSDPAALEMLQSGELEFFTLMGGILGRVVPVAEIQGLPFAFSSHGQVHQVNDGELGQYIGKECAAKGIYRFQFGLMENGFRQIGMIDKPIQVPDDLVGMSIRVPDGEMFRDLFSSLGAKPVTINISELYDSLKRRKVDGQENPLVITEVNKLYEVGKYQSITNHMWSGFNLLANLKFWNKLPEDIQQIVQANVKKFVALQRTYTNDLNRQLETTLAQRGQIFNTADATGFRKALGDNFYRRWKEQLGSTGWSLLEKGVGNLV